MARKEFTERYREGFIEDCSLTLLAERYGTPLYLYSKKTLQERVASFQKAFLPIDPLIRYSCKANSNLYLLKIIRECGCGVDVISAGEIAIALAAGFQPSQLIMEGPGKRKEELEFALEKRVSFFSVESLSELRALNRIAGRRRKRIMVLLRLNPNIPAGGHRYITTGRKENKFGLTEEEVVTTLKERNNYHHLEIAGLHLHLGSQIATPEPYLKAIRKARQLYKICPFGFLDLGGGFPIAYDKKVAAIELFGKAICKEINGWDVKVIFEPGRYLVAESGFLLTRVIYRKDRPHKRFLVVDAGMNDLVRPSLYGAYHHIQAVKRFRGKKTLFDVVGPICESGDFLGKERFLPEKIKEGDLLLIAEAGAYGFAMASNYNGRLRPAEVLVDGADHYLIRQREDFASLLAQFPKQGEQSLQGEILGT